MPEPQLKGAVVHRSAGRVRLRFPALRGAEGALTALAARLATVPGVTGVAAYPLTGSVLLRHGAEWAAVASAAAAACAIAWEEETAPAPRAPAVPAAADLRLLLGGALALMALWQLGRRQMLPPALTLLWYAATLVGDRLPSR